MDNDQSQTGKDALQIQRNEECKPSINTIKGGANGLSVFKIFGQMNFSFKAADAESKVDWSGLYTQLDPEHSMRYLTKKWDDGADYACLVNIRLKDKYSIVSKKEETNEEEQNKIAISLQTQPNFKFQLLKIEHHVLSKHSVSGKVKAEIIKQHLSKHYKYISINSEQILIKALGQHKILLQCIDSEDQEIIFSHDLLREYEDNFEFEGVLQFKKSNDGMLRTVCWRQYTEEGGDEGWVRISGQQQFQPHLLLQNVKNIRDIVQKYQPLQPHMI